MNRCRVCGIQEDTGPAAAAYGTMVEIQFKGGTCSSECARTLVMVRAICALNVNLTELVVVTAPDGDYGRGNHSFEDDVSGILDA